MQQAALAIPAMADNYKGNCAKLREANEGWERYLAGVADGEVRPEELILSKRLTRPPVRQQPE